MNANILEICFTAVPCEYNKASLNQVLSYIHMHVSMCVRKQFPEDISFIAF